MTDTIDIGLMGLGTIGRGVWQLLSRENEIISTRLGCKLNIKKILVANPDKERGVVIPPGLITTKAMDIIGDDDIEIVVEVIGGTGIARRLIKEALAAGKSVVTANKELMADRGREILEAAEKNSVDIYFEASVGGGIPIIHPLKECLIGNRIQRVMGIINGTTNFILSKLDAGREYDEALAEAQALGFAERNPVNDIEGRDAGAKIAILASIAFNSRVTAADVYTEGIAMITPLDIMYARELGFAVKLLAVAKFTGESLDVRVHPTMIPLDHPLASVKDVYNAIFVEGDAVGELMFFGQGAGSLPTASAIVADVFQAAGNIQRRTEGQAGCTCLNTWPIMPIDQVQSSFYLLIEATDRPGVLAKIAKVFGDHEVGIGSVIQKQTHKGISEVVFMTHKTLEGNVRASLKEIAALDIVAKVRNVIRVEVGLE